MAASRSPLFSYWQEMRVRPQQLLDVRALALGIEDIDGVAAKEATAGRLDETTPEFLETNGT